MAEIQNWPVQEVEEKEDMGFRMRDNQEVGTAVWDEYPTYDEWIAQFEMDKPFEPMMMMRFSKAHFDHLPVWSDGNVYFNGAKAWKNEQHKLIDNENKVYVKLHEQDGKYCLETNVYDFLGDFKDGIITSDVLGCAFEPEERFENTDGTAITFDSDYLGEHRGISAIPGPFASKEAAAKVLFDKLAIEKL